MVDETSYSKFLRDKVKKLSIYAISRILHHTGNPSEGAIYMQTNDLLLRVPIKKSGQTLGIGQQHTEGILDPYTSLRGKFLMGGDVITKKAVFFPKNFLRS